MTRVKAGAAEVPIAWGSHSSPPMAPLAALRSIRPLLVLTALVGLGPINGLFLWALLTHPDLVAAAQSNPVSLVFLTEAFVLTGLGAVIIARLGLRRPGWVAFVAMALAGSLAFAVPAFVLWRLRQQGARAG